MSTTERGRRVNEMSTEMLAKNWRDFVGRFSVEVELANHEDVVQAKKGFMSAEDVRRGRISGFVDTEATRLVLPASIVATLGLPPAGQVTVKYADGRREPKGIVGDVELEIQGRSSVFTAVVEPGRSDALIGAIVLEELDLLPDCTRQVLIPRDPSGLFAEIESVK